MAKPLPKGFQFPPKKRKQKYNWEQYIDGPGVMLKKGEDFASEPASVRNAVQTYAREHKLDSEVHIQDENTVLIRLSTPAKKK